MIEITDDLERQYRELQDEIDQLQRGGSSAAAVKKLSAPFGVYAERDGKFMARVRRLNGQMTANELEGAAGIMNSNGIAHAHFSTRCNMQLHGVPPENVCSTLTNFGKMGMVFKGGGGNTFRSVSGSPYAGVSQTERFDTTPYMQAVWKYISQHENAFNLGRKFKLAFSAEAADEANSGVQDLGLLAVLENGQRGFKVYGGGGLGRGGVTALELISFLPAELALQAVVAAVDLFHDHGDREDRSKARLRFVRQRIGDDKFRELYCDYLDKCDAPLITDIAEVDYSKLVDQLTEFKTPEPECPEYRGWVLRSVDKTKFENAVSVRLYVRKGVFKATDLRVLASILRECGAPFIRLAPQQDVVIPLVHKSALPFLYKALSERLGGQAVTSGSYSRHIVSCIGAQLCSMGLVDSASVSDEIADALDDLFEEYGDILDEVFEGVIDGIRLSGCGSSCGLNQIAAIGFNGHRKKIDGVMTDIFFVHIGGEIAEEGRSLALSNPEWWIRASDAPTFTANMVREYLEDYRSGNQQSLRKFMLKKRNDFDPRLYL